MTEYLQLINYIRLVVYFNTSVWGGGGKSGHFYFHFFEAFNDAFEGQFYMGLIFTSFHRHW